jgi:antitoxin component YwqK of YwqJK toxin-antitoxin module
MNSAGHPVKVPYDDLDYDEELTYEYEGSPCTGVAFEDVPGKWYTEIRFQYGMQTGPAREWTPTGVLKSESEYRNGVLHGESSEFDEGGRLLQRKSYEYGILVGGKISIRKGNRHTNGKSGAMIPSIAAGQIPLGKEVVSQGRQ